MRNESLNNHDNASAENNPWVNFAEEVKTPLADREGNVQLGVNEAAATEAAVTETNDFAAPEAVEEGPLQVDLKTPEYDALFENAESYIKKAPVEIVPVTEEGLSNGEYADKDVSYDKEQGAYIVTTYVMNKKEDGSRVAEVEQTRVVKPGDWLATNPKKVETDHANNYPMSDESFHKLFQPSDQENIYYKKVAVKMIQNPTGKEIVIPDPWGKEGENKTMTGDAECMLAEDYKGRRYIISANDFEQTYVPAEKQEDAE